MATKNEETSEEIIPSDHYTRLKKLLNDLITKATLHGVDEQQSLTESPPKQIKDNVITIDLNTIAKKRTRSSNHESPKNNKRSKRTGGKPKSTKPEQKTKSTKTKTK